MAGWSNLSNDWFRMQHNLNQTIWASGIGSGSLGGRSQIKLNSSTVGRTKKSKKNKKVKKTIQEQVVPDLEIQSEEELIATEETEITDSIDSKKGRLEHQAAALRQQNMQMDEKAEREGGSWRVEDPTALQEAVLWAEILGEPVSVKRRKKRMSQIYGN